MLARRKSVRFWLFFMPTMIGVFALIAGSVPALAADDVSGPVVTIQFHTYLSSHPFWLNYQAPKSRYFATLDACVDPLFATIPSGGHDFGNCFSMQAAKADYTPISLPEDAGYVHNNEVAYWTRPVQVIMPDQFAHTLDLTTEYVFHDRGQTTSDGDPLVLEHSVLVASETTISASDGVVEVQMDGSIPHEQTVHFVFHPIGKYDVGTTFWGCLRRPSEGVPSAYCAQLGKLSRGTFQIDAKLPAVSHPDALFGPDVDPLLEGTNIQMTIVAASGNSAYPDAQPAPPHFAGHPVNQIVTPGDSTLDCAMSSTLVYLDQTLECSASINHDTLGQLYLFPTAVKAYIGSPPSFAHNLCVICSSTRPLPYAGPLLLALLLLLVGAGGIAMLMFLGRVPLPAASGRPLVQQPMFVSSALLALVSLVFLVGMAVQFRTGSQPAVPGKVILQITPGASPVENDVPPSPTPTPTPTPTPSPTPTPLPSPTVSPEPAPSPTP